MTYKNNANTCTVKDIDFNTKFVAEKLLFKVV